VYALRRLKVPQKDWPVWVPDSKSGAVHIFDNIKSHSTCCIVCIRTDEKTDRNVLVGLLVHEAVHVWRHICDCLGEHQPSKEFDAYSIQSIVQRLLFTYDIMVANVEGKSDDINKDLS
jgi:hypothetical protein